MKIHYSLCTVALALALVCSCKKDDTYPLPEVVGGFENEGSYNTSVGDSLLLHPQITNNRNMVFQWTVNGEQTGKDSILNFKPAERGLYKIALKGISKGGEINLLYEINVLGKYENGFYIINEGWFGHGVGTVSYYNYKTGTLTDTVFVKENSGKSITGAGSTLQYGTIYDNELFLVAKIGGNIVKTDAYSMKEKGRVNGTGSNWQAIVGTSKGNAVVSSAKGLYLLNTSTMTIGNAIGTEKGLIADLYQAGDYIFAISQSKGLLIINKADYSTAATIPGMIGCAITPDGNVWAIGGTKIFKINSKTLETSEYACPFRINGSWGAWHPASVTASTTENAIFFEKTGSFNGTGTEVYKFSGDVSSLNSPFAKIDANKVFYGSLGYDKTNNLLVVLSIQGGWRNNSENNTLYFFDAAKGGTPAKTLDYKGFHFPSCVVFQN